MNLEKERDGLSDDDDGASRRIEIDGEIEVLTSAIIAAYNKGRLVRAEAKKERDRGESGKVLRQF